MVGPSRDALAAFVAELVRVRRLCGSPSLNQIVAHAAGLSHPLARSTVSDKLNARSLPDWDFVASFVTACRMFAATVDADPPDDAVDLARWDERHLRLLRDLDVTRDEQRLAAAAANAVKARGNPLPRQLPATVRSFSGRSAELRTLAAMADDVATAVVVAAIHGTAGVGKTALAVHAAHQLADRFPDGQLYVNLRGFDPGGQPMPPGDAVRRFLEALSVPPNRLPATADGQAGLYRSLLAERRMLVVLDNARDAEQVRPLVPGSPGCLVLVTSRDRLTSLAAREGAHLLPVDLLTDAEARDLLSARLGADRVCAEADAVDEIIARCARLPLALGVVAARAATRPAGSLAGLARELGPTPDLLDVLDTADPATGVRSALSWSYRQLSAEAAALFRALAVHPGPDVGAGAVAGLAGLPPRRARAALGELTEAHLVVEAQPGRYGFHDLLRAYAGECAAAAGPQRDVVTRMLDHYLHTAYRAAMALEPNRRTIVLDPPVPGAAPADPGDPLVWFAAERRVLLELIDRAAAEGLDTHAWRLAWTLPNFLFRQGRWADWARAEHAGLAAAKRSGDRAAEASSLRNLGFIHMQQGDIEETLRYSRRALALYREIGDPIGTAHAHTNLAATAAGRAERAGDDAERCRQQRLALRHCQRAVDLYRVNGNTANQGRALSNMGWAYVQFGEFAAAVAVGEQSLALHEQTGLRQGQAAASYTLARAHRGLGDADRAVVYFQRAGELFAGVGEQLTQARTLVELGDTWLDTGDSERAREAFTRALAMFEELDHPDAAALRDRLTGA